MKHNDGRKVHAERVSDTLYFRFFEAFAEAAPQLVLQLYIMLKDPKKAIG